MHELEHESIITNLILVATLSDLVFIEYRSKGVQQRPVCTYILAQGLGTENTGAPQQNYIYIGAKEEVWRGETIATIHGALAGRLLAIRGYLTMIIMVRSVGPNFGIAGPVRANIFFGRGFNFENFYSIIFFLIIKN